MDNEGSVVLILFVAKHSLVVLKKRLYCNTLLLNICEFALNVHGPHDGRGKYDSDVQWGHLVERQ